MTTVHIIGAGISGLAAATQLAAAHIPVRIYESSNAAGGRARASNHSTLGSIDHGLHLMRGSDSELRAYLTRIGAAGNLRPITSPLRLPFAPVGDYLNMLRRLWRRPTHADAMLPDTSPLREEWLLPWARVMLGVDAASLPASALARHITHAFAPAAQRWFRPRTNLSHSLIQPALDYLDYHGAGIYFGHALKSISWENGPAILHFARKKLPLDATDILILATPASISAGLVPQLAVPEAGEPAITCHFACDHREPTGTQALSDAPADLIDYQPGRISLSCRVAQRHWHGAQALHAQRLWKCIQQRHGYLRDTPMPEYAFWREKQAGHQLSEQRLPAPQLPPRTLLAGDWLDATAPASLNTAAGNGHAAASAAIALLGPRLHYTQSLRYS